MTAVATMPSRFSRRPVETWPAFRRAVERSRSPLLYALPTFPDAVLVAGCQRSGTTALTTLLLQCQGVADYRLGGDSELEGALLLAGVRGPLPAGRRAVFQTTYLNGAYLEYSNLRGGDRLVWVVRHPLAVVDSMLSNWRRAPLARLFRECGAGALPAGAGRRHRLLGAWAVSRLEKACAAYNGKTTQVLELLEILQPEQVVVVDYDSLVAEPQLTLPRLFARLQLQAPPGWQDHFHAHSRHKPLRLRGGQQDLARRSCETSYRQVVELVPRDLRGHAPDAGPVASAALAPPGATAPRMLLLTSDKFPPFRMDVLQLFARELRGRGYRLDWLLQAERSCKRAYEARWEGGRAWVAPTVAGTSAWRLVLQHLLDLRNDWSMLRLLRAQRYDLLQVKDKFLSAPLAILASRVWRVPLVYWLSFPFPESWLDQARTGSSSLPVWFSWGRGHLLGWLLRRVVLPSAEHVFVQSDRMKADVCASGIEASRVSVVPMGVALEQMPLPYPRPDVVKPVDERWLVYLGTLARERMVTRLVPMLARVREEVPGAVLVLVGFGNHAADEAAILQEAARLGVAGAVRITGRLPRELAWQYAAAADLCLSPYLPTPVLASTSPTKLVEYLALGRPVVATEHPEQERILAESGGGLLVPFDEGRLADAVVSLLRDPAAAEAMGARGRMWVVENRSYARIAAELDEQYRRILGLPPFSGGTAVGSRQVRFDGSEPAPTHRN